MIRSPIRRFGADRRGVAIVEFAMLAPLMILLYVGMVELVQGLMAERRSAHAASAIGDLVAQAEQVSAADVDEVFNISQIIMQPFEMNGMQVRVSSVRVDNQGVPRVTWSRANGYWTPRSQGEVVDIPEVTQTNGQSADFLAAGQSTVMAEVIYEYESAFTGMFANVQGWFGNGGPSAHDGFTFDNVYYLQPRQVDEVRYTG